MVVTLMANVTSNMVIPMTCDICYLRLLRFCKTYTSIYLYPLFVTISLLFSISLYFIHHHYTFENHMLYYSL